MPIVQKLSGVAVFLLTLHFTHVKQRGLVEIFRRFDLRESEFQERVNEHFKRITSAIANDSWVDPELLAVDAM